MTTPGMALIIDGNNLAYELYQIKEGFTDSIQDRLIQEVFSYYKQFLQIYNCWIDLCFDDRKRQDEQVDVRFSVRRVDENMRDGDDAVIRWVKWHKFRGHLSYVVTKDSQLKEKVRELMASTLSSHNLASQMKANKPPRIILAELTCPGIDLVEKKIVPKPNKTAESHEVYLSEPTQDIEQTRSDVELSGESNTIFQPLEEGELIYVLPEINEPVYWAFPEAWAIEDGTKLLLESTCDNHRKLINNLLNQQEIDEGLNEEHKLRWLANWVLEHCSHESGFIRRHACLRNQALRALLLTGQPLSLSQMAEILHQSKRVVQSKLEHLDGIWLGIDRPERSATK
jgi:hypothetical protein